MKFNKCTLSLLSSNLYSDYLRCFIFIAYGLRIQPIRHLTNSNWQLFSCLIGVREKLETWEIFFIKLIFPRFDIIPGVLHFYSVTLGMYSLNHSFHSTILCLMMKKRRTFCGKNKFEETVKKRIKQNFYSSLLIMQDFPYILTHCSDFQKSWYVKHICSYNIFKKHLK